MAEINNSLSSELAAEVKNFQKSILKEINKQWISKKGELLTKVIIKKEEAEKALIEATTIKEKLVEKVQESEALSKITEQIKNETIKYETVTSYSKKISAKKNDYELRLSSVAKSVVDYRQMHHSYANIVNDNMEIDSNEMDFSVKVIFKSEAFDSTVKESINNNSLKKEGYNFDDGFSEASLTEDSMKNLIDKVINGELKLLKNRNPESVLREILNDWYLITYDVRMENDNINQMSPGKKALVLLKLLISMADSKCPILIDQPEDDLDNRSIFDELIPFIREKKITRQILIVTHNANVVLGGDAEEIIIANQSGNNSPNEHYRFEYRSGSIENDYPIYEPTGKIKAGILNEKGIQQHICDILEGGEQAFDLRKNKYRI